MRNCTGDEGRSFEVGNQVLISSHRKLLLSKALVVSVAETPGYSSWQPRLSEAVEVAGRAQESAEVIGLAGVRETCT
jgi:hypothetical protein